MFYQDISPELINYIQDDEASFNSYPLHIREMLVTSAEEQFQNDHEDDDDDIEVEDFPIVDFTITVDEKHRSIKYHGKKYRWRERDVIGVTKTPVTLTPNNVESMGMELDTLRDQYTTDGYTPYQYTISYNGNYLNTSPNSTHLISRVNNQLDEYENLSFTVDEFVIRFKKGYTRQDLQCGITAGNGEGISRKLPNGYWLLDLFQAKTNCIPNAYTLWTMYKDGSLDDVIQGNDKEFYKRRRVLPHGKNIKFEDVVGDDDFDILYEDESIANITPKDTKNKCYFSYINGHVGVIINEKYLKEKSVEALVKSTQRTFLHKILPKNSNDKPIKIVTADIESFRRPDEIKRGSGDNEQNIQIHVHEPLLIAQYDGKRFVQFRGENALDEYCEYLVKADKDWLIWWHNGGKYDTHFLLKPLTKYANTPLDYPIELRDLKGKFLEVKTHLRNGHTITFRDSCSLIPGSLEKIAKDMDVTRKLDDVDIMNVSRHDILHSKKIREYNRIDCKSLYEILEEYQETSTTKFGTNPLHHVSASSFAKKIFYSKYYNPDEHPLYVLPRATRDFIAGAYGGGRNEIFRRGHFTNTPIFPYDFTSFYPSVGREKLPYGIPLWKDGLDNIKGKDKIKKFLEDNPGFYEVEVLSSPKGKTPLHGIFHEHRYMFPHFKNYNIGSVFSVELLRGLELGYRYKIFRGYTQPMAPICKEFFEEMIKVKTDAKKNGKPALEYSGKITANAGYGYFGFDPYDRNILRIYGESMVGHLESLSDAGKLSYRKEGDVYIAYETTNVLLPDVNVSVAAAITSYARIRLHELIQDIKDAGGKLYYCDTDSVYSSINIIEHKVLGPKWCGPGEGDNLGELAPELKKKKEEEEKDREYIVDAVFIGCKMYGYITNKGKYHLKSKGTNNPKPMNKPGEDATAKDKKEYQRNIDLFEKLKALLDDAQIFNTNLISTSRIRKVKKDMEVYDETISKKITGIYTKGKVLENGKVVPKRLYGKKTSPRTDDIIHDKEDTTIHRSEVERLTQDVEYEKAYRSALLDSITGDDYDHEYQSVTPSDNIFDHVDDTYPSDYDDEYQPDTQSDNILDHVDYTYPSDYEDYPDEVVERFTYHGHDGPEYDSGEETPTYVTDNDKKFARLMAKTYGDMMLLQELMGKCDKETKAYLNLSNTIERLETNYWLYQLQHAKEFGDKNPHEDILKRYAKKSKKGKDEVLKRYGIRLE